MAVGHHALPYPDDISDKDQGRKISRKVEATIREIICTTDIDIHVVYTLEQTLRVEGLLKEDEIVDSYEK